MSRILLASLAVAATVAVPVSGAHAATCVVTPTTGTTASVCVDSEGVSLVPGGVTSASTVWVTINSTTYCIAIGRTTVATGGVAYYPPYFC
jgi:hypothetical protein